MGMRDCENGNGGLREWEWETARMGMRDCENGIPGTARLRMGMGYCEKGNGGLRMGDCDEATV